MTQLAKALILALGSVAAAIDDVKTEGALLEAPKDRYGVDAWGRIIDCKELDDLGYKGLYFFAPFALKERQCTQVQAYNITSACACDIDGNDVAAAFRYEGTNPIGNFAPTKWNVGEVDRLTGYAKPVDEGYFVDRTIPTRFKTLDAMLSHLKANPIDFKTRAGGPVATGQLVAHPHVADDSAAAAGADTGKASKPTADKVAAEASADSARPVRTPAK